MSARQRRRRLRLSRDIVSYTVGIVGIIIELLSQGTERPQLLTALLALVLGPLVLHRDETARDEKEPPGEVPKS